MNTCMNRYATQAEQDAAREEWFANMDQRREDREKKESKRVEDEKFWREWWDKDLGRKPGKWERVRGEKGRNELGICLSWRQGIDWVVGKFKHGVLE